MPQDVIVSIGESAIDTPESLSAALASARLPLDLTILRGHRKLLYRISDRKLGIQFNAVSVSEEVSARDQEATFAATASLPVITTTDFIPNHVVSEILGIVSGEAAFNIEPSLTDLVFPTSGFADLKLNQAVQQAFASLTIRAAAIQADAVVGVRIDTSGANKNVKNGVFIALAIGTAVKLAPVDCPH